MPTPNKSAATATTTNGVNDNNDRPTWDTSDTGRATHLRSLETYLSAKHPECATLVEYGYVISKDTVYQRRPPQSKSSTGIIWRTSHSLGLVRTC